MFFNSSFRRWNFEPSRHFEMTKETLKEINAPIKWNRGKKWCSNNIGVLRDY